MVNSVEPVYIVMGDLLMMVLHPMFIIGGLIALM